MNVTFAKELYGIEWARRDQLHSAVSTPLGVLTLLGTAIGYCYVDFQPRWTLATVVFIIAEALAAVLFSIATYQLVRSYVGYTYRRIADASEILEHHKQLTAYHAALGSISSARDEAFDAFLVDSLVEATDKNCSNNTNRGEHLHRANLASVACMLCLAIAAVPYAAELRLRPEKVQKFELRSPQEVQMTNPETPKLPQKPVQPPVAVPPTPPARPVNKNIRIERKEPKLR